MRTNLPLRYNVSVLPCFFLLVVALTGGSSISRAAEPATDTPQTTEKNKGDKSPELVPLNKQKTVLLDPQAKKLLIHTKVVLREGLLEMLCCLKQTKEHESILAVDAKAYTIHAGLLALGVEQGTPVRFEPEFQAATGTPVHIYLTWTDEKKNRQRVRAQEFISRAVHRFYAQPLDEQPGDLSIPKETKLRYDAKNKELTWYGRMIEAERDELLALSRDKTYKNAIKAFYDNSQPEEMKAGWVFVGSGFYTDPKTGEKYYQAEGGDVICVANFPSALIDVAIPSSASGNENLLYEAYTERIPPMGTDVLIEIVPDFDEPVEAVKPN